jgi:hypothetical protein
MPKRYYAKDVHNAFTALKDQAWQAGFEVNHWELVYSFEYRLRYQKGVFLRLGKTPLEAVKALGFIRDGFALANLTNYRDR